MQTAAERQAETLDRMSDRYGETVTLFRASKGLSGAAAGRQAPVPSMPKRLPVLFTDRRGGKNGGSAKFYVRASDVEEHSLASPGKEWDVKRDGEPEAMRVRRFRPLGAAGETAWWVGDITTGSEEPS